jgi:hypothetical protein
VDDLEKDDDLERDDDLEKDLGYKLSWMCLGYVKFELPFSHQIGYI